MAPDHRSDDQESLFSADQNSEEKENVDLSSEEERLRNGDISFRPVSLPGSEPEPSVRKTGTGGMALMIVVTIVVVLILTWVIYTFYSPSPSGPQQTAATDPAADLEQPGSPMEILATDGDSEPRGDEPAAIFQAHAELQENYQQAEQRIAELESELQAERVREGTSATATASPADSERLDQLEKENSRLNADLEKQRRDSESAVSRAEQLVQRAESQVVEERGQARAAREETDQFRRQAEALTTEKSVLAGEVGALEEQVGALQAELTRRKQEYDRLSANTTTRMEGESDAVRQLMTRHTAELEQERKLTREKEAEVQRLTELIARLSVADTAPGATGSTRTSGSTTSSSSTSNSGAISPPRILTKSDPAYPMNARRLRVEGTVLLNVLVGADGRVREVKVLEADGGKLLSPAAVDAVREWTFSPATRDGRPLEVWHKVSIQFAL